MGRERARGGDGWEGEGRGGGGLMTSSLRGEFWRMYHAGPSWGESLVFVVPSLRLMKDKYSNITYIYEFKCHSNSCELFSY